MSEGFIETLLSLDGGSVTLTGILILFIVGSIIGLNKGVVVTGGRHGDLKETCTKCETSLTAANAALEVIRERDVQSRIELERLRTQREYGWQAPRPTTPERAS